MFVVVARSSIIGSSDAVDRCANKVEKRKCKSSIMLRAVLIPNIRAASHLLDKSKRLKY